MAEWLWWTGAAYLGFGVLAAVFAKVIAGVHSHPMPWWRYPLIVVFWLPALLSAVWKRAWSDV